MAAIRVDRAEALAPLLPAWRDLMARSGAPLFQDPDWLEAWWAAFAAPQDRLRVYAAWRGEALAALLPMYRPAPPTAPRARLTEPRALSALFNHYLGRSEAPAADAEALDAILGAIRDDRADWDVVELPWVPEDGALFARLAEAPPAGLAVHAVRAVASPFLALGAEGYAGWYARRFSSRKRQQDRRRLKKATARGARIEVLDAPAAVLEAFEAGLAVEALGWKGEQGSAMRSRSETAAFMRDVVQRFADRGQVRLVTMHVEAQLAAFLLGFAYGDTLYFHKTGMDPAFDDLSPGRVVLLRSIEDAFARGLARYDFLGAADPYKLQCSPTVRPHSSVFLYHSGLRSRAHRRVKRTVAPLVKRAGRGGPGLPVRLDRGPRGGAAGGRP